MSRYKLALPALGAGAVAAAAIALFACGQGAEEVSEPAADAPDVVPVEAGRPEGPLPALLMVQAHFTREGPKPVPQPAKMTIWRTDGTEWWGEEILDPDSNVFHKAVPWRDGILTIGAMGARLVHWTRGESGWSPEVLWERSWGGAFDRLRDLEIADVDHDGADEIILASHDQGVVAVGDEVDGEWVFTELDQEPDVFVHEIEVGDVDGDGALEFYATPSARNRASMESQPGKVVRYDYTDGAWTRTVLASWAESHAKEILVTEVGGSTVLYAVREAHAERDAAGQLKILDPVRVVQLSPGEAGWSERVVATLDDRQCRFLVPGDVDGDGQVEIVAAGYKSGLWVLEQVGDGTWAANLVDADSGGYEHATHVADLDGDGALEIYAAADEQGALRRYTWSGTGYDRAVVSEIPKLHITWNLQDGVF